MRVRLSLPAYLSARRETRTFLGERDRRDEVGAGDVRTALAAFAG
jgi:hypothetical protein